MNIELYYPNWKKKALTFSYDDGDVADRKLVNIFNRYNMKATFHLVSNWIDGEGYVKQEELLDLYKGHEVACHGADHKYPTHLAQQLMFDEFYENRKYLEKEMKRVVRGCSYAFGEYSDTVVEMMKNVGIVYSRTVEATHTFQMPADFMRWKPTCHHSEVSDEMIEQFLNTPDYMRLPLLYIWGHSFEFEQKNNWNVMENLCQKLQGKEDVWYTTNIDYYNYVQALRNLVFSTDGKIVENPLKTPVYIEIDGEKKVI